MPYKDKDIEQEYQRNYRQAHKAVLAAQQGASFRLRRYGVTPEDFIAMLETQHHCCACCHVEFSDTPIVDHDHETGEVRGLLCRLCNSGIGMLGDNIEGVLKAYDYLTKKK